MDANPIALDQIAEPEVQRALAGATRDNRDNRDALPTKGRSRPDPKQRRRDTRDKPGRARFELFKKKCGFKDGVYWVGIKESKETGELIEESPAWVCSLLTVMATTRNGTGNEWGRLLVFHDRDAREHRWAMPMSMLAGSGDELRAELLSQGLEITSDGNRRRRLLDYIQWETPEVAARCVTRTGWHGDTFVLPAATYGDTATEPVIFQTTAPDGIALAKAGTLEGWRDEVATPCVGNSRLVLALSAGFAGPCLGLVDAEGGGLHLREIGRAHV